MEILVRINCEFVTGRRGRMSLCSVECRRRRRRGMFALFNGPDLLGTSFPKFVEHSGSQLHMEHVQRANMTLFIVHLLTMSHELKTQPCLLKLFFCLYLLLRYMFYLSALDER